MSQALAAFQNMPGGDTVQAQRMQKLLAVYSQSNAMRAGFQNVLNDGNASASQKAAARLGLGAVKQWTDVASGSKNLDLRPYVPIRFAGAEMASQYSSGAAAYGREKDQSDYAGNFTENQKKTNEILGRIETALTQALTQGDSPIFSGAGAP